MDVDAVRAAAADCRPRLAVQPQQPDRPARARRRDRAPARAASPPTPPVRVASRRPSSSTRRMPSSSTGRSLGLRDRFPNLIVVRTASKAYALAGLRVGFAIARPGRHRPTEPVSPAGLGVDRVRDGRHGGAARSSRGERQHRARDARARAAARRARGRRLVGRAVGHELPARRLRLGRARSGRGRGTAGTWSRAAHVPGWPPARRPPAADGPRARTRTIDCSPRRASWWPAMTTPLGALDVRERDGSACHRRIAQTRETDIAITPRPRRRAARPPSRRVSASTTTS